MRTHLEKGQYTIRIYDDSKADKIEKTFLEMQSLFKSKNKFISKCLELGVSEIRSKYLKDKEDQELDLPEKLNQIADELSFIAKAQKEKISSDAVRSEIQQKNASCLYHMILNLSKGTPLSEEDLDNGNYDYMPNRFKKEMLELIRKFK